MNCCQCQGIEAVFNDKMAADELKSYRKKGPSKQTQLLIDTIARMGVEGLTLLDIGGGVGAVQYGLLAAGAAAATDVDASASYLKAAQEEANRRGQAERITHRHGNFVDLAPEISPADVVTLDRVICCYHDMRGLVEASSARARKAYGVVYPVDVWWTRLGAKIAGLFMALSGNPFRIFVHSSREIEAIINEHGLKRVFHKVTGFWQVIVYARS